MSEIEEATGTTRHVDYIKSGLSRRMNGPKDLVVEISTHAEFNKRGIALALFDEASNIKSIWWFQGSHNFPQDWLTEQLRDGFVCPVFCNLEGMSDDFLKEIIRVITSDLDEDSRPFWVDALVIKGNSWRSLMCDGDEDFCQCDPEGNTIILPDTNTIDSPELSALELIKQLKDKYKEEKTDVRNNE